MRGLSRRPTGARARSSFRRKPPHAARRAAALAILIAAFSQACGDGSTSGNGGSGTTGNGGQGTGTSTSTATAGASGSSGSGTGAGGAGASSTGGNGTGGSSTGASSTGGSAGGGTSAGGASTGASGGGGAGTGGVGGGAGGAVGQAGTWMAPPAVQVPDLPAPPDYSGNPVNQDGEPIVVAGALVDWVANTTPDAITARELCAQLVSNCYEPGVRSLDACMMSAPHCVTATPWTEPSPCCADACFTAYATLRTNKVDPLTAYLRVLYDSPICMPGVDALLGGMTP